MDTTTPEAVARVRALLEEVAAIMTAAPLADEPGGHARASLMPDIDFVLDLASADDPRRIMATIDPDGTDDLAGIFERIAQASPRAVVTGAGLAPHDLLSLYAQLLEEGASVTLMTTHEPTPDPDA